MTATTVLYSPGFGAGWSTWNRDRAPEQIQFMLTHAPTIDALYAGERLGDEHAERFLGDWAAAFPGVDPPYMGGFCDLALEYVEGAFRVEEYDGSESVVQASTPGWIEL